MVLLDIAGRVGTTALSTAWSAAVQLMSRPDEHLRVRRLPASTLNDFHERGFAVVNEWLPADSVSQLLEEAHALQCEARPAGVGASIKRRVDDGIRRTRQLWLHPPPVTDNGRMSTRLALSCTVENLRAQLSSDPRQVHLSPHLTELSLLYYPTGGYYERHLDVRREGARPHDSRGSQREVSFIVFLDREWRAEWGGALRLHPEPGPGASAKPEAQARGAAAVTDGAAPAADPAGTTAAEAALRVDVQPEGGTLVLLRSAQIEHEVLRTRRPRHCVVGWLRSSATATARRSPLRASSARMAQIGGDRGRSPRMTQADEEPEGTAAAAGADEAAALWAQATAAAATSTNVTTRVAAQRLAAAKPAASPMAPAALTAEATPEEATTGMEVTAAEATGAEATTGVTVEEAMAAEEQSGAAMAAEEPEGSGAAAVAEMEGVAATAEDEEDEEAVDEAEAEVESEVEAADDPADDHEDEMNEVADEVAGEGAAGAAEAAEAARAGGAGEAAAAPGSAISASQVIASFNAWKQARGSTYNNREAAG